MFVSAASRLVSVTVKMTFFFQNTRLVIQLSKTKHNLLPMLPQARVAIYVNHNPMLLGHNKVSGSAQ
jgi:hypothetical protein